MSDNNPIPSAFQLGEDTDESGFGEPYSPSGSAAAAPKAPHKPLPLGKILAGIGGGFLLVIVGLGYYVSSQNKPKQDPNQFGSVPQPAIAQQSAVPNQSVAPAQMQPQTAMQPQGIQPQNMGPSGAQWTPGGAPGNPGQASATQMANQPMDAAQVNGQSPAQLQPQQPMGQQPMGQAPAPVQAQQMQAQVAPTEAPSQPMQQPYNAAPQVAAPAAQYQQPATAAAAAPAPAQPSSMQKADTKRAVATTATASQDPSVRIAELEKQLSSVQGQLAKLQRQDGKPEVKAQPAKAAHKIEASTEDDTQEEVVPERKLARVGHTKASRAQRKHSAADSDTAKQETGYAVTGMIGGRGFITKIGSSDVNPDASYAAGEALPDGRKVTMVDQKQKRVWLSDGKYIAVGN